MNRIEELEESIRSHRALYYQGRPKISDREYDQLEEKLKALDPQNKVLNTVGSLEGISGKKARHQKKMLSLNKTYKLSELESWLEDRESISTLKVDGVSCALIYQEGVFTQGKTRGDGTWGEDISKKIDWISSIPSNINISDQIVEVRGEIYCDEKNFIALSCEMKSLGLDQPTSLRNIVAGLVGRKDHLELCRYLKFIAFELLLEKELFKNELDKMQKLNEMGFTLPSFIFHQGMDKIEERLKETEVFMSEGDYQIDGAVFTLNDLKLHQELGATAHHPRYKIAFKFQGESKTAEVTSLEWSVSRNGVLTPIAIIAPVTLSGASITRVTLHNFGMARQYNIKKGDMIEIVRSGEVIPKFLSVVKAGKQKFNYPKKCPICESEVEIKDIRLFCTNERCSGKRREAILNFIQKIGIDDISEKRLNEMMKENLVKDIPDLYKLNASQLMNLDKVKDKLANKLVASIENSKSVDLITFLSALGISGGAYNKCEKVVSAGFDTLQKIQDLSLQQLTTVPSFAEKSAGEFIKSLQEKKSIIEKLLNLGFNFSASKITGKSLAGKKICITGTLSIKRGEMEKKLRGAGAAVVSSISKNTDFLLSNEADSKSSKFKKARELGVKIISEKELAEMIE